MRPIKLVLFLLLLVLLLSLTQSKVLGVSKIMEQNIVVIIIIIITFIISLRR